MDQVGLRVEHPQELINSIQVGSVTLIPYIFIISVKSHEFSEIVILFLSTGMYVVLGFS